MVPCLNTYAPSVPHSSLGHTQRATCFKKYSWHLLTWTRGGEWLVQHSRPGTHSTKKEFKVRISVRNAGEITEISWGGVVLFLLLFLSFFGGWGRWSSSVEDLRAFKSHWAPSLKERNALPFPQSSCYLRRLKALNFFTNFCFPFA